MMSLISPMSRVLPDLLLCSEHSHRDIKVDSYDVTIFPAESIKNTVTKKAKLKRKNPNPTEDEKYSAWFFDLAGRKPLRVGLKKNIFFAKRPQTTNIFGELICGSWRLVGT